MSEVEKPVVERLDVDNYATWKTRMKFLLISKGLWSAVQGTDTSTSNDQKALAQIGLYVKEHHLAQLERCDTAKKAWEHFESVYQAKSSARKLQLRKELSQLKMGQGEPLTKYVGRAQDIQDQLRAAGHTVADQELTWAVLAGLPTAFDTVVTVLETTIEDTTSLDDILPKLLQVEQRERQKERPDESALMVKPYRGIDKTKATCHFCGKKGHFKRDCWRLKNKEAARRSGGHKKPAAQPKALEQLSAHALAAQHSEAAGVSRRISTQRWVLDTGASRHMTPYRALLVNEQPLKEDITVTFGNGSKGKPLSHGDVILHTGRTTLRLTDVLYVPEATENLFSVRHATNS
eukprot:2754699-Rhodomonas_salina.1